MRKNSVIIWQLKQRKRKCRYAPPERKNRTDPRKKWALANDNIDVKISSNIRKTIIRPILIYSIHLFPISQTYINKLQAFYSKSHRRVILGRYNEANGEITNLALRRTYIITTLDIPICVRYIKQLYTWRNSKSFAYLNNKIELGSDLTSYKKNCRLYNNFIMR